MMPKPQLTYYQLGEGVTAFSTTRHGGFSTGSYGEFNVNRYCGDDAEAIRKNRQILCKQLRISDDRLLMPHQVHGTGVSQIGKTFFLLSKDIRQTALEGVDALMTNVPEVCIGVSTADCIPIIIYDPEHHAASVVHSGWRGTVANIAEAAVASMQRAYHSRPEDLKAVIGPGISLDNFEVGDEVYDQFSEAGYPMGQIARRDEKWHIDLWRCCQLQLEATGIPSSHVQTAGICTYAHSDDYFSARKLTVNSGRILTGVILRLIVLLFIINCSLFTSFAQSAFTPLEQQKISIETPGLFEQSDAFTIDFSLVRPSEYSFPLPVGTAEARKDYNVEITTTRGDAVKAMFDGVVRMSWEHPRFGKIIVLRHANGLETVYGRNAENRVKVGDQVKAGQTIAIVGGDDDRVYCEFAVMVNGARINPDMILDLKNRRLRLKTILCRLEGDRVRVTTVEPDPWDIASRTKKEGDSRLKASDPFKGSSKFTLKLSEIAENQWCYPLPGAKVISPYGQRGGRGHSGTDLKTKPNDPILAAFDGVVTMSQVFYGYGNCIVLRHDNGLETLYSHNSKNLVKVGDSVKCGQKIALTGRTGRATTEHLHFEIRVNGRPYNSNMIFDHANHRLLDTDVTFYKNGGTPAHSGRKTTRNTRNQHKRRKYFY